MTANQINFQAHLENVRHNQASEGEIYRHNLATENQASAELAESKRHNVTSESENQRHNTAAEEENKRHNVSSETISAYQADTARQQAIEQARHNAAQEVIQHLQVYETGRANDISAYTAVESARHNIEVEGESNRHNVASEKISDRQATSSMMAAQARDKQANNQAESNRLKRQELQLNAAKSGWGAIKDTLTDIVPAVIRLIK